MLLVRGKSGCCGSGSLVILIGQGGVRLLRLVKRKSMPARNGRGERGPHRMGTNRPPMAIIPSSGFFQGLGLR